MAAFVLFGKLIVIDCERKLALANLVYPQQLRLFGNGKEIP